MVKQVVLPSLRTSESVRFRTSEVFAPNFVGPPLGLTLVITCTLKAKHYIRPIKLCHVRLFRGSMSLTGPTMLILEVSVNRSSPGGPAL